MTDFAALKKILGDELVKKVFYCGLHNNNKDIILYIPDEKTRSECSNLLKNHSHVSVKTTQSLKFERTRSLEEMINRLPRKAILCDPTLIVERASLLVTIAKQVKFQAGKFVKGCYFNSETRTLHVVIKANSEFSLDDLRLLINPLLEKSTLTSAFNLIISLNDSLPLGAIIAIDRGSEKRGKVVDTLKSAINKLKWPLAIASASGMGLVYAAEAPPTPHAKTSTPEPAYEEIRGDQKANQYIQAPATSYTTLPAVAYWNAWTSASVGWARVNRDGLPSENGGTYVGELGTAFPIGHSFGGQFNLWAGSALHHGLWNADGYLFWRDPAIGLFGAHYRHISYHHVYANLYGFKGDAYISNWNLSVEAGEFHTNVKGGHPYAELMAQYYVTPDWRLDASYFTTHGDHTLQLGTEYQMGLSSLPGLTIFADVGGGSHDLRYAYLGLRYYFGCPKSLLRRQREDMIDPTFGLVSKKILQMVPKFHS